MKKKKEVRCRNHTLPPIFNLFKQKNSLFAISELANLTRSVADDYIVNFGLMTILGIEFCLGIVDELLVEIVANQVDGAATEAATHDT